MKTIFSAFTTKKQTILINKVLKLLMVCFSPVTFPLSRPADVVSVNLKTNNNLMARVRAELGC